MTRVVVTEDVYLHLLRPITIGIGPRILSQLRKHPNYIHIDWNDEDRLETFATEYVFGRGCYKDEETTDDQE